MSPKSFYWILCNEIFEKFTWFIFDYIYIYLSHASNFMRVHILNDYLLGYSSIKPKMVSRPEHSKFKFFIFILFKSLYIYNSIEWNNSTTPVCVYRETLIKWQKTQAAEISKRVLLYFNLIYTRRTAAVELFILRIWHI